MRGVGDELPPEIRHLPLRPQVFDGEEPGGGAAFPSNGNDRNLVFAPSFHIDRHLARDPDPGPDHLLGNFLEGRLPRRREPGAPLGRVQTDDFPETEIRVVNREVAREERDTLLQVGEHGPAGVPLISQFLQLLLEPRRDRIQRTAQGGHLVVFVYVDAHSWLPLAERLGRCAQGFEPAVHTANEDVQAHRDREEERSEDDPYMDVKLGRPDLQNETGGHEGGADEGEDRPEEPAGKRGHGHTLPLTVRPRLTASAPRIRLWESPRSSRRRSPCGSSWRPSPAWSGGGGRGRRRSGSRRSSPTPRPCREAALSRRHARVAGGDTRATETR